MPGARALQPSPELSPAMSGGPRPCLLRTLEARRGAPGMPWGPRLQRWAERRGLAPAWTCRVGRCYSFRSRPPGLVPLDARALGLPRAPGPIPAQCLSLPSSCLSPPPDQGHRGHGGVHPRDTVPRMCQARQTGLVWMQKTNTERIYLL